MVDSQGQGTEIEFNSMVAILKRLDTTTYGINEARASQNPTLMVDRLVEYYKEIAPDLTPDEDKIWKRVNVLKRFANPLVEERTVWILNEADEVDILLRTYAKKHGYLTKNVKDRKKAILEH